MGPEGSTFGVQYVQQAIRFAADMGCPIVDTTDGAFKTEGYSDDEVFHIACENYKQCLSWAEDYNVILDVETHGPYTTDGDFMDRLFTHFDSEYLRLNFDTGNTFISGRDPLEYLKRFRRYLGHVHIKDVSPALAAAVRGEETGIGCSEVPIGKGVNASNISALHRLPAQNPMGRRPFDRVLRRGQQHSPGVILAASCSKQRQRLNSTHSRIPTRQNTT